MKRVNNRKSLYEEKTKIVPFRCPESKIENFKTKVYEILDGYAKELTSKKSKPC